MLGGYLLACMTTLKYVFDYHAEVDVLGCMVDLGWITGSSYIVYGPLGLGGTSVIFESVPTYPSPSRYWQIIQTHRISHFLVAPTTIRALRRLGDQHIEPYDLSSLRVIGTTGEPIGPDAWNWLHKQIGKEKCSVLDAYWQTESVSVIRFSILIAPFASLTATKPGSATLPFFGVAPAVVDPLTGKELAGNDVTGVLCIKAPWPSIARTLHSNHSRYISTYMRPFTGYYFTGDGATRDMDGFYWIRGRLDDIINVSGHRLSTQEVESALLMFPLCAEAAVVGVPDDVTGQAVFCFVTLREQPTAPVAALTSRDLLESSRHGSSSDAMLSRRIVQALSNQVKIAIGPFATPKRIVIAAELPKTRSGKILRRLLRLIASGQVKTSSEPDMLKLGDVSTLGDPSDASRDYVFKTIMRHPLRPGKSAAPGVSPSVARKAKTERKHGNRPPAGDDHKTLSNDTPKAFARLKRLMETGNQPKIPKSKDKDGGDSKESVAAKEHKKERKRRRDDDGNLEIGGKADAKTDSRSNKRRRKNSSKDDDSVS
ncbi:acetyl-CoA synthetase [Gonapodya sp. JEL0774]|nr:acetyl-CoA synthetase [Gonapodya sp. JEL0774]